MRRRVVWSDPARTDYLDLIWHIARDNPQAAALAGFATGRRGRVSGTCEKVVGGLAYIIA